MILDAIIGLLVAIFEAIASSVAAAFLPLMNLLAAGIEAVVCLFVSGFRLGRLTVKKRENARVSPAVGGSLTWVILLGLVGWLLSTSNVMKRQMTLVADDGHSLPFAAIIVHTNEGDQHMRTDHAGAIELSRFGTHAITVKDPRYVERRWEKAEMKSPLVVERTVLGAGLDSLADRLLKPAKDK